MFNAMMEAFMEEVVGFLFNLEVKVEEPVGLHSDAGGVPMSAEVLEEMIAAAQDDSTGSDHQPEAEAVEPEADHADAKRPVVKAKGLGEHKQRPVSYSAPSETGDVVTSGEVTDDPYVGVGRNAPCPCGSGKKYKMCHGRRG